MTCAIETVLQAAVALMLHFEIRIKTRLVERDHSDGKPEANRPSMHGNVHADKRKGISQFPRVA